MVDFHFLCVSQNSLFLMVFVGFDSYKQTTIRWILNAKLPVIFPMLFKFSSIKFTPLSAMFVEFCKQMRFLLFVLLGNVYD